MELQFATTRELIDELSKRSTFVGVIIHSQDEHRAPGQVHCDFRTITKTDNQQTIKLLDHIAAYIAGSSSDD